MRRRSDHPRTTPLSVTRLEDRTVPDGARPFVAGEWVVMAEGFTGTPDEQVGNLTALIGQTGYPLAVDSHLGADGTFLIDGPADQVSIDAALAGIGLVAVAEPNHTDYYKAVIPNDTRFGELYGLNNTGQTISGSPGLAGSHIGATDAWERGTGTTRTLLSSIDSGVDYTHPDLYLNIAINPGEIPAAVRPLLSDIDGDGIITFYDLNDASNQGTGKITDLNGNGYIDGADLLRSSSSGGWEDGSDADRNGFRDDLVGWDFANDDNDPMDDDAHGTHTTGTMAAIGDNGRGVAGVNWTGQVVAIKFLTPFGGSTADAIASVNYSARRGVKVSNNSWGGGGPDAALRAAIKGSGDAGQLFIAAAGNGNYNNDATAFYPASYPLDNIISVASGDNRDRKSDFSQWGKTSVDVAAPGTDILSTIPGGGYEYLSGTSMASPHVAGLAGLAWSLNPAATAAEIRNAIFAGVDPVNDYRTNGPTPVATGGRVNVVKTLNLLGLSVSSTDPAVGSTVGAPLTDFTVTFNQAVKPASVGPADFTVNGLPASGVSVSADALTVTFTFAGSPLTAAGTQTLAVAAGAIESGSAAGQFNRAFSGAITVVDALPELVESPLPAPLTRIGPVGWQAYEAGTGTWVNAAGDADTFTVDLDAGTRVTAVVDQVAAGLRPTLTVTGPLGTVVGTATAAAAGSAAKLTLDLGPAGVAGTYRLTVTGADGTAGAYRARVITGGSAEGLTGDPTNDTLGTATLLDLPAAAGVPVGTTVAGAVTAAGDPADTFAVALAANETLSVGLAGPGAVVQLLNSNSQVVGTAYTPTNYDAGLTFAATAQTAGTYYVQVTLDAGAAAAPYALGVFRNGLLEREGNDTALTAQPLPAGGGVVRGGIDTGNADFYTLTVPAGTTLTVWTSTPGGGPGEFPNTLDPVIDLFRGATLVGSDDDSGGDNNNALVRRTNLAAGAYTIRVTGGISQTDGVYQLHVTTAANPGPINLLPGKPPETGVPFVPGRPVTVAEGGALTLHATGTDPNGDSLTLTWDLNGDGVFTDAVGADPTLTWAQLQAFSPKIDNAPGLFRFPVRVRATDGVTAVTSPGVVLAVTNTAPTGTPVQGRTVGESDAGRVGFAGPTDVTDLSAADRAAGLRYSYDFDANGTWDLGDGTYAGSVADAYPTIPQNLIADGPGGFTTVVRLIDQDGGATDYPVTFNVVNTPPVVSFGTAPVSIEENQPDPTKRTVPVGTAIDSAADALAGFRYSFSLDGGTTWAVGNGESYAGSAAPVNGASPPLPASAFPDGPATVTITGKVFDKDGGVSTYTRTIDIVNVAPVAAVDDALSTGTADEGGAATVVLASPIDPSPVDTAAGFRYSYSLDGGLTWVVGDGTYAGSAGTTGTFAVPAAALDDGSGTVTVTARVIDKDNRFTQSAKPIVVRNVAPTAVPVVAPNVVVGLPLTVSFGSVVDPSAADTRAGFKYSFDFNGDGDFNDQGDISDSPSPTAAFTYQRPGVARIGLRVTDRDGGFTTYNPANFPGLQVAITNVSPTVTAAPVAPIDEGSIGVIRVTAAHPSAQTTAATFRYAYDFDGDRVFDLGDGASYAGGVRADSATIPARFLTDGGLARDAVVRVYEVNGLFTDLPVPVTIRNVAPTARLVPPAGRIEVREAARFTAAALADASSDDLQAGFTFSWDFNNDGDFADAGEVDGATTADADAVFTGTGPKPVRLRVTDKDGGFTDYTTVVTVGTPTKTWYAAGVGADNLPVARLYDQAGNVKFSGQVFDAGATGGVRVVTADVNGDGVPDLIAATGPGVPAQVKVIDGNTRATLFDVRPFGTFTGGAFVAAGDVDGDGFADVAVTPDEGGGPRVVMYSGKGFRQTASFFGIADAAFRGGARVSMADVNGDGLSDLLVAAGFGGGPRVAGYDGAALGTTRAKLFSDFFAFDPSLRNGVYLSGGDMTGDGRAEVVVGAGPGGGPQVIALDGLSLLSGRQVEQASFFAADIGNRNGVRVSVADIDADGRADIVTGDASGPKLTVFRGANTKSSGAPADPLEVFPFSTLTNGVFVG